MSNGTSNHRSGGELSNSGARVGAFEISTKIKASLAAEGSKQGTSATDGQYGKGTAASAAKGAGAAKDAYDAWTAPPVAERYAGSSWNPQSALAGDAGFESLRKLLDEQAAQSDATRTERLDKTKDALDSVAAAAALFVPFGTAAAAAYWAASRAFLAFSNWYSNSGLDSKEHRNRADAAVKKLWSEWMIVPPAYIPELDSAKSYADRVENILRILNLSELDGSPWREEWLRAMKAGMTSSIPAARDVSHLGWIPVNAQNWIGIGFYKKADGKNVVYKAPYKDKGFGTVTTVTVKQAYLSAKRDTVDRYEVPTYAEMLERTDPYAAGVGVMVATMYGVAIEPVVEAAVIGSRAWLEATGPNADMAGRRLKGTFEQAVRAAKMSPKNPMLVRGRDTLESRLGIKVQTVKQAKEAAAQEAIAKLILRPEAISMVDRSLLADRKQLEAEAVAAVQKSQISRQERGYREIRGFRWLSKVKIPKLPSAIVSK